ncbi:MAG: hypothetical protein D6692_13215 [Planctomycetota bacterium]|nr:MAG: hypothetical protein D6692_13215 [Planctomycetota bacterium]
MITIMTMILIAHPVAMWLYQPSNPLAEERNLSRLGLLGTSHAVVSALCGYSCGTLLRKHRITTAGGIRLIGFGSRDFAAFTDRRGWMLKV